MARKILIADPDLEAARLLSRALRQRSWQVHYAPDGSKALEVAVLRHPDLVLIDEACDLITARTFAQILRSNPRTGDIPVLLTTRAPDPAEARVFRDGVLQKPFNQDEVLSRLEHIFRRSDAARELTGEAKEIEGHLEQLAIPDLLQVLAMNRRSGRVVLHRGYEQGEIAVAEGRPVNAKVSVVEGEKALFRLLTWTEGTFAFMPGTPPARTRIQRAMEDALLEGMRQADEVARLRPSLPPGHVRLVLASGVDLAKDQHPVTAQVVELLRVPRSVSEVLDLAPACDLDVMVVLGTLLQKSLAKVEEEGASAGRGPLLGPAEVHGLRTRLTRGRPGTRVAVGKVFLCGAISALRKFLRNMPNLTLSTAEPGALRSGFGTLARCEVGEGLYVDFCLLPASEAARPLWRPFCTGALGAMVLDASDGALAVARFLGLEIRMPLLVLGEHAPAALAPAPAGCLVRPAGELANALRSLLMLANSPSPQSPTDVTLPAPPA